MILFAGDLFAIVLFEQTEHARLPGRAIQQRRLRLERQFVKRFVNLDL